jgi:hypothetical protein
MHSTASTKALYSSCLQGAKLYLDCSLANASRFRLTWQSWNHGACCPPICTTQENMYFLHVRAAAAVCVCALLLLTYVLCCCALLLFTDDWGHD